MSISSAPSTVGATSVEFVRLTLHRHTLRSTAIRQAVLTMLLESSYALSGSEIEKQIVPCTDRITLYRTLRIFEEKGLVHRVIDHCDIVRYAASSPAPAPAHVHFKCTTCRRLYCLHEVIVPPVELPALYHTSSSDYLLSGVCATCHPQEK
ncbi:Fur family transcriptional regulator [Hymenobacter cellulosilyticus]|uniref:Transcriptional repressor n=1 Tax=Hymenobacter cellulosilyticus TaxID=2932248 RepID=A0A8T9PYP9_9BACT|nr:transcriptional repressor [Hymenobacter cellulosilyticus]UOQ70207.1 transcriptional repressor [Hymenobacter cellulosilyticus]